MLQVKYTNAILGAKGSGKSVLLCHLAMKETKKVVLFDVLGVFNPRNEYKTATIPNSYYCMSIEDFLRNINKFPEKSKIVINLSDYNNKDLIESMDAFCLKLMEIKKPISVLSDEVADIMPQNGVGSEQFHKMVKNGRNYGITPITIATQRPQSVNKNVFDLCDTFLISSQKAPRTVDYIASIIDVGGDENIKQVIKSLKSREFIIYDGEIERFTVPEYPYAFKQ